MKRPDGVATGCARACGKFTRAQLGVVAGKKVCGVGNSGWQGETERGCDSVISAIFSGESNSRNRKEEASPQGCGIPATDLREEGSLGRVDRVGVRMSFRDLATKRGEGVRRGREGEYEIAGENAAGDLRCG